MSKEEIFFEEIFQYCYPSLERSWSKTLTKEDKAEQLLTLILERYLCDLSYRKSIMSFIRWLEEKEF